MAVGLVFIGSLFVSCSKNSLLDIEPSDRLSESAVFNDVNLLQSYVYNTYNGIRAMAYPAIGQYDGLTDILVWNRNFNGQLFGTHGWPLNNNYYNGFRDYVEGNITPDNVANFAQWQEYYKYIAQVNSYFEKTANSSLDPSDLVPMNGEMRFIRAWIYFDLSRIYGGVPLVTSSFDLGDPSSFEIGRSTYDEVAQFVVSECDLAANELDGQPEVLGKINATAAKALKAKMLLYMASPLNNVGNDMGKWAAAETATMDVLNSGKSLAADYSKIPFKTTYQANEIILARTYTPSNRIYWSSLNFMLWPGGAYGTQSIMPTQKFVDMYPMSDGKKITDPDSGYDPQKFWENRDPRFYNDIMYPGSGPFLIKLDDGTEDLRYQESYEHILDPNGNNWNIEPVANPNYSSLGGGTSHFGYPTGYNFGRDGFTYFDKVFTWPGKDAITRYQSKKYMDFSGVRFSQNDDPTQMQLLFRITEFYLNMAEIKIAMGDESAARGYLNQIRARVGMPDITSTGGQLVEDYRNERAIELHMEDHRFFDILRWKTAPETIGQQVDGIVNSLMDWSVLTHGVDEPGGAFGTLSFTFGPISGQFTRNWDDRLYLLPIPAAEIERSGNKIDQNPGY